MEKESSSLLIINHFPLIIPNTKHPPETMVFRGWDWWDHDWNQSPPKKTSHNQPPKSFSEAQQKRIQVYKAGVGVACKKLHGKLNGFKTPYLSGLPNHHGFSLNLPINICCRSMEGSPWISSYEPWNIPLTNPLYWLVNGYYRTDIIIYQS